MRKSRTLIHKIIYVFLLCLAVNLLPANPLNAGADDGATVTCNVTWTTTSNSITIYGLKDAGHAIFKLFSPSWSTVFDCVDNCSDPLTINGLTSGATYHLSYNLYNNNWQPICQDLTDVAIEGGSNNNFPDLRLTDMQSPASVTAGIAAFFNFDLVNSGNTIASGDYLIEFYLSTDNNFSNNDTWVGELSTGNTPVGTIDNVPGGITIPAGSSAGNYYLLGVVDADKVIEESNENNNTIARAISVQNNNGGNECGFIKTYNNNNICLLYTSPSPRDRTRSRMPSSA